MLYFVVRKFYEYDIVIRRVDGYGVDFGIDIGWVMGILIEFKIGLVVMQVCCLLSFNYGMGVFGIVNLFVGLIFSEEGFIGWFDVFEGCVLDRQFCFFLLVRVQCQVQ